MTVHKNSHASHEEFDADAREALVLSAFRTLGTATDREVLRHLSLIDMNEVRPTITSMVQAGRLSEVGSKIDDETKRTVRVCEITVGKAVRLAKRKSLPLCPHGMKALEEVRVLFPKAPLKHIAYWALKALHKEHSRG